MIQIALDQPPDKMASSMSSSSVNPALASLATHPANPEQARAFTAPSSLSFPGGAGDLTPPSEKDGQHLGSASGANANTSGQQPGGNTNAAANGLNPATPAATPGAVQGVSGIVPTLQ